MRKYLLALPALMTLTWGAAVYQTPATDELSGARSTLASNLVVGHDSKKGWSAFSLSWDITGLASGLWQYTYTLSGFGDPKIGHAIFELSPSCAADAYCITNAVVNGSPITGSIDNWRSDNPGNPGMAADIFGIKLDDLSASSSTTISFISDRAPVYGNFYAKGGQSYVYNSGLGISSSDPLDYIARPDGVSAVPEPSSAVMLLIGIAGVAAGCLRRRARQ